MLAQPSRSLHCSAQQTTSNLGRSRLFWRTGCSGHVGSARPVQPAQFKPNNTPQDQMPSPRSPADVKDTASNNTASSASNPDAEEHIRGASFLWTKQWYPVAVVENLDPTVPHQVTLMGVQLAVWQNPVTGTWACVEDCCPHRAAPLSQGQVVKTTGQLRCAYHGWTFDQQGKCTDVPSSANPARICNMRGACVLTRPAAVVAGLLWVWGESGPVAHIEAAAAKAPGADLEVLTSPDWFSIMPMMARLVPVTFEGQLDNWFDMAHAPFVHHGMSGIKREAAVRGFTVIDKSKPDDLSAGLVYEKGSAAVGANQASSELLFYPPAVSLAPLVMRNGMRSMLVSLRTPVSPGYTLNMGTILLCKPPPLLKAVFKATPTFVQHIAQMRFADGDFVLLHEEDRRIEQRGWRKSFLIPDPTDAAVKAARVWLDKAGPIAFVGDSNLPPRLPREQVLDRYSQHVSKCKHCQQGLMLVKQATVLAALAAGLLAYGAATAAVPGWLGWVGAPLLAGMSWALHKYQRNFFFVDYDHRYT